MKSKFIKGLTIVALVVSVSACEMDRTQRNTAAGAAIGVIGSQVQKGKRYYDDDDD